MNALTLAIFDNAFPADLCRAAAAAWPAPDWSGWHANYQQDYQKKRACARWEDMPEPCKQLLGEMMFLDVSHLGLGELIPDAALWGGGMHALSQDGIVGMHLDASHHRQIGLPRRLNGILFLNETWDNAWGGALQLWDENKERPTVEIFPKCGRLVLFASNDTSWHTVTRLTCPPDVQRKTLACWWYSKGQGSCERDRAKFVDAT